MGKEFKELILLEKEYAIFINKYGGDYVLKDWYDKAGNLIVNIKKHFIVKVQMIVQDGYVAKDTQDAILLIEDFDILKKLIKGYNIDLNDKQEIVVEVV